MQIGTARAGVSLFLVVAVGMLAGAGCPTVESESSARRIPRTSNPANVPAVPGDSAADTPPDGPTDPGDSNGDADTNGSGSDSDGGDSGGGDGEGGDAGGALAPIIREIADVEIPTGTAYSLPAPALDSGTLPVFWALVSAPDGAVIDNVSGVVTWGGSDVAGAFEFQIRATNAAGSDDETWMVTVEAGTPPPPPPVVAPDIGEIADDEIVIGAAYAGPVPALRAGTPPIFWSLVDGPEGAVIDNATGVVSWPGGAAAGEFAFHIRASNSVGFDEETWVVRVVSPGVAPQVAPIADAEILAGQSYVGPIPTLLAGTAPVTWSLIDSPAGATLSESGVVSWDDTSAPGDYGFALRASNAAGHGDATWTVHVLPIVAPDIAPTADVEILTGAAYVSTAPTLLSGTLPVFWSLTDAPDGSGIASDTGIVIWGGSPIPGDFAFTVRATNSGGFDEATWTVHVVAPTPPDVEPLADAQRLTGEPYTVTPTLLAGTPPVTWVLLSGPADAAIDPLTGVVTWDGSPTAGDFVFSVRANNAAGFDDETWTVHVVEPPAAPDIAPMEDVELLTGEAYVSVTPTLLSGTLPVFWSLIDGPEGGSIDFETGVVSWGGSSAPGEFNFTIQAINGAGADQESWTVRVSEPQNPPDIAPIDDVELPVDTAYESVAPSLLSGTLPVFWALTDGPDGASIDFLTGVVNWGGSSTPGDFVFTVQAINAYGTDDETWTVHVMPPSPPEIAPIDDVDLALDTAYVSVTPALLSGTLPVFWSLVDGPDGTSVDFETGVVTWVGSATPGDFEFTIQATNAQGADTETWTVHVLP